MKGRGDFIGFQVIERLQWLVEALFNQKDWVPSEEVEHQNLFVNTIKEFEWSFDFDVWKLAVAAYLKQTRTKSYHLKRINSGEPNIKISHFITLGINCSIFTLIFLLVRPTRLLLWCWVYHQSQTNLPFVFPCLISVTRCD